MVSFPGSSYIQPEPYGVVGTRIVKLAPIKSLTQALLISPWNYPISLVFAPLIAAIGAGNACVVKCSEVSVNTSRVIASLIPKYLDADAIGIVEVRK